MKGKGGGFDPMYAGLFEGIEVYITPSFAKDADQARKTRYDERDQDLER